MEDVAPKPLRQEGAAATVRYWGREVWCESLGLAVANSSQSHRRLENKKACRAIGG